MEQVDGAALRDVQPVEALLQVGEMDGAERDAGEGSVAGREPAAQTDHRPSARPRVARVGNVEAGVGMIAMDGEIVQIADRQAG